MYAERIMATLEVKCKEVLQDTTWAIQRIENNSLGSRTCARDNNAAGIVELLERGAPPSYSNRWDLVG